MGKHHAAKSCLGLVLSLALAACAQGTGDDQPSGDDGVDVCGDGSCTGDESETSCAADCDGAGCGDGACNNGETSSTCPQDCGNNAVCGDGTCAAGENAASCAQDCGTTAVCGDGTCNGTENNTTCAGDCPAQAVCGDGTCGAGEDATSCAADCGGGGGGTGACDDGICDPAGGDCESVDFLCVFACGLDPANPCGF